MQDTHSLHVFDGRIDLFAGKKVFDLLVLGLAVAGFFIGQNAQLFGMGRFGNGFDYRVNAFLSQLRELGLGGAGGTNQGAGFLDGQ